MIRNENKITLGFVTVVWLFFASIAVVTKILEIDAGGVGILAWVVTIFGIIIFIILCLDQCLR